MAEGKRRRARIGRALWVVLRLLLTVGCFLVAYFLAPMDREFKGTTAVVLIGCLAGLGALVAWHAYMIARSRHPRWRAAEALAGSIPIFVVLFAAAYFIMENTAPGSFSQRLTRLDAMYFTVTVLASVGFGDIVPVSETARLVTMLQMLGDMVAIGLVARVLLEAVRRGLARRGAGRDSG